MKIKLLDYKKLKTPASAPPVEFFENSTVDDYHLGVFFERISQSGIQSLNIVASANVEDYLVLCNSSNTADHMNQMIITAPGFWKDQANVQLSVFPIELDAGEDKAEKIRIDISSMVYSEKNDCMVFIASAVDGAPENEEKWVSPAYIGILEHFARKIGRKKMKVNELVPLSSIDKKFKGLSIGLVALTSDKEGKIKTSISAQNDKGTGYQIKVRIKM